jgi:carbonic anhydrase
MPKALKSHISGCRLDKTLDETQAKGWTIVDLKNEWNRLLSFEKPGTSSFSTISSSSGIGERRHVVKKPIASTVVLTMVMLLSPLVWAQDGKPPAPQIKTRSVAPPSDATHWTYEGEKGPQFWGKLDPDFSLCADGHSQSPVDIAKTSPASLPKLRAKFSPTNLRIVHHEHLADEINNGHTIQVNYSEGDTMTLGDADYELIQFHFHAPSEHTVQGKHYPMEMHFVHKSPSGALAVIGVFIKQGAHNAAFDPIWSNLPTQKGLESHFEHVQVNVDDLLPHSHKSYRYDGSLTTPPCSEGVKWIVMKAPIQLSAEQIARFTALIKGNNRPVQPLNHRVTVTDDIAEEVMAR